MSPIDDRIDRLIEVRRFDEARRLLREHFAEAPDDPDAHVRAAWIAFDSDDLDGAASHSDHALRSDPAHVDARYLRFRVALERGDHPAAERHILDLIREYPEEPDFIAAYGRVMLEVADTAKARALAVEALRGDPSHRDGRLVLALVDVVDGRGEEAGERLSAMFGEDPGNRSIAFVLFRVLVERGREREAYELGRELLRLQPDNEALVDTLVDLRMATHALALPLWPLRKWGWAGSAGLWIGGIAGVAALRSISPRAATAGALVYLAWALYSWVYPPLMRRWLLFRGLR